MISMEDDSSNVLNDHKQESDIANEGNSNNGAEENAPDSDTIKMFVGQIPKTWDETKLKEFFQQYGPVYHLNVLRDKETENSRGCCFVTFYHRKDAINAQNALHNIFVMPGLSHPVQMKPADIENRNDRKLFVGMLNKTLDEDGIRDLFKEFGQIEDCTILRENGKSKGCAFLTFVNRSCAHQAIRKMNQSQIFEGCTKPVVVKFADAGKDKNVNKKSTEENRAANGESCAETSKHKPTAVPSAPNGGVDVLTNLVSLLQQPGIANLLESARVLQQLQTPSQPQPIFASTPSASIGPSPTLLAPVPSLNPVPLQQCQTSALSPQQTPKFAQSTPFPAQTSASNLLNFSTPGLLLQRSICN